MTAIDVTIRTRDILSPEAQALIAELNQELILTYPEEEDTSHFRLDPSEVAEGNGAFLVAFRGAAAVGCGAVRRIDPLTAELKRMYVAPEARGLGVGRALLVALEEETRRLGLKRLVLETAIRQASAISLYESYGFTPTPSFGAYTGSPLSVCMGKDV
jgi:putative acetyltransferase